MKKLIAALFVAMSSFASIQAQDTYICHTVLFCLDNGKCFEIEICDIVEANLIKVIQGDQFLGGWDRKANALTLKGFSEKLEGHTLHIKPGTTIRIPDGKGSGDLVGREVKAGKYMVNRGRLNLKLGSGK